MKQRHLLRRVHGLLPLCLLPIAACAREGGAGETTAPPLVVAPDSASNPTVAYSVSGEQAFVAWVGVEDGRNTVFLARLDGGGSVGEPVRVNDLPGDAAPHLQAPAQVAVGPEGNVYVLWQNNTPVEGRRFPASDLRLAVSTDGGRSFRPAVTVNDDAGGPPSSHTFHDIAVGADGAVYVSWIDSRVRDAIAHQRRPTAAPAGGGQERHEAVHAGGDPVAASHDHDGHGEQSTVEGPEIRIARSTDAGRTFGASVVVDSAACPCCHTSLALGPVGEVYVAWRKIFPGSIRDVVVARADAATMRFDDPVRVHEDGWEFPGCPHAGPSLAVDPEGRLLVGWYTGREGRQGLWYAESGDDGRTWSAPDAVLTGDWIPPSQLRLAVAEGRVWAAWDDLTSGTPIVRTASGRVGEALAPDARFSHSGSDPAIAASGEGAVVAWLDGSTAQAALLKAAR